MKWGEITELHPSRFVLIEAIQAKSNNRVRHLEDMSVIQDYDNPQLSQTVSSTRTLCFPYESQ